MHNNLHQPTPEYKTGDKTDCKKLGGLNKSARIINTQHQRAAVEEEFMRFALKIGRSDKQREIMTIKKFDYTNSREDIFYKIIYPIYAKEFLFGNNYENFAFLVSANFILNPEQWEYILQHWEEKQSVLTIEKT